MQSGIRNRGFASMDAAKQREIARKGGRAAHARGTAHEFNANEARAAGRKGGESVSANRDHMSRIGRIGGKKSAGRRAAQTQPASENGQALIPGDAAIASETPERSDAGASPGNREKRGRSDVEKLDEPESSSDVSVPAA